MSRLSLMQRFLLMGSAIAVILTILLVIAFSGLSNIGDAADSISQRELPLLDKAHRLKLHVVQVQQWLTDISATRGLDGLNDGFDEAENNAREFRSILQEIVELDRANAEQYRKMLPAFEDYYHVGREMAEAYVAEGPQAGNKTMARFDQVAATLAEQVEAFLSGVQTKASAQFEKQRGELAFLHTSVPFMLLLLVLVTAFALWMLYREFKRLPAAVTALERVSQGDLSGVELDKGSDDEIGRIFQGIRDMKGHLRSIIGEVSGSSGQLAGAAGELSNITSQTREAIGRQQAEIDQVVTAINQMTSNAQEVAANASAAADSTRKADASAVEGGRIVETTISSIETLAQDVRQTAEVIQALQKDSEDIGNILNVIRGIAEQTNLLALNAAIEAARAGEQGRGFAVVADEVRTLASRTQESTREIQEMIERLQSRAQSAVNVMRQGQARAEACVTQAGNTGNSLQAITQAISEINEMNVQIAAAASQQSSVAEEINRNIVNIHSVSDQSAASAQQTSESARGLAALAGELQGMVGRFSL